MLNRRQGENLQAFIERKQNVLQALKNHPEASDPNSYTSRRIRSIEGEMQKAQGYMNQSNKQGGNLDNNNTAEEVEENEEIQLFNEFTSFSDWYGSLDEEKQNEVEKQWTDLAKQEVDPYFDRLLGNAEKSFEESQKARDISRRQATENYNKQIENLKSSEDIRNEDYENITKYAKTDFAKNLARVDKGFAKALDQASYGFGIRNIGYSGVQKKAQGQIREQKDEQIKDYTQNYERGMEKTKSSFDRGADNIDKAMENLQDSFSFQKERMDMQDSSATRNFDERKHNLEQSKAESVASFALKNKADYQQEAWRKELERLKKSGENISN